MAELHRNFIAGEWIAGADVSRNINPSDLSDVIGEYARADGAQAAHDGQKLGNIAQCRVVVGFFGVFGVGHGRAN
jgi:hypothetical protein